MGRAIGAAVIEPLVRRSATDDLEPRLAVTIPSFANGDLAIVQDSGAPQGRLVAVFRLRAGLTWHDGPALTAHDVAFAFAEDRAAAPGTSARSVADRIDHVDVIDDLDVRVSYRAGERWDLFALAPRALPRHLLQGATPALRAQYARAPVHAGAYRITERAPGRITLDAFGAYAFGRPSIERVVVRAFADRAALLGALLAREVDVAPSPGLEADLASTLDRSLGSRGLMPLYTQAQAVVMLRFGPRLADPNVREAVALTVDRERIGRAVFGGRVRIPSSYLVAPLWAADETGGAARIDRAAASGLMQAAGFTRGNFGIAQRGADRLVVTILVPAGSVGMSEAARGVAADLAILGIAADVSERPRAEIEQRVLRRDLDLALTLEEADDPLLATERWRGVASPWVDVLAAAAAGTGRTLEGRALYVELQRLWAEAVPALPLYQLLKVDVVPAGSDAIRPASHAAPLTWDIASWRRVPPR